VSGSNTGNRTDGETSIVREWTVVISEEAIAYSLIFLCEPRENEVGIIDPCHLKGAWAVVSFAGYHSGGIARIQDEDVTIFCSDCQAVTIRRPCYVENP